MKVTEHFPNRDEGGRMRKLAALSAADKPMVDPECTLVRQMGDGRDSQGNLEEEAQRR